MADRAPRVTVLGGGTGTPKLLRASARPDRVTAVANTGDDVEFGDLFVCPDLDSLLFVAAGILDTDRWWGIAGDTEETAGWLATFVDALDLGDVPAYRPDEAQTAGRPLAAWRRFEPVPEFMTLGDRDRAIHRVRSAMLDRGRTLTEVTRAIGDVLDVAFDVLPMSDDPVTTLVHTTAGPMHFQEYWVARRGDPTVEAVEFRGAADATTTPAVEAALEADLVVVGPSNPVTSLGPITRVDGVRRRLEGATVLVVSPFRGEAAFSGPAIELMRATDLPAGTPGLGAAYPFADGFVLDAGDETALDRPTNATDLSLETPADADRVWGAIESLRERIG